MKNFFKYNWQVRDEWFEWCKQLPNEDLLQNRIGGVGSILYTLFHIVDVEYSWIRSIQGQEDVVVQFRDYHSLDKVKLLSDTYRNDIVRFLQTSLNDLKDELVTVSWSKAKYTRDEILHHIIAHEIHHIGQLSIWARELEQDPVTASFVGRISIT